MSPVIGVGPRCTRCHKRPVWAGTLCSPCWRLAATCGHPPLDMDAGEDGSGQTFEILDADSLEFERSLAAWLSGSR